MPRSELNWPINGPPLPGTQLPGPWISPLNFDTTTIAPPFSELQSRIVIQLKARPKLLPLGYLALPKINNKKPTSSCPGRKQRSRRQHCSSLFTRPDYFGSVPSVLC